VLTTVLKSPAVPLATKIHVLEATCIIFYIIRDSKRLAPFFKLWKAIGQLFTSMPAMPNFPTSAVDATGVDWFPVYQVLSGHMTFVASALQWESTTSIYLNAGSARVMNSELLDALADIFTRASSDLSKASKGIQLLTPAPCRNALMVLLPEVANSYLAYFNRVASVTSRHKQVFQACFDYLALQNDLFESRTHETCQIITVR
jgi:hypothetical protein